MAKKKTKTQAINPARSTRRVTIVAQSPLLREGRKILTAQVEIPYEPLAPGPRGHRVEVIDYDASATSFYKPLNVNALEDDDGDPFPNPTNETILKNPQFHCMNAYATIMMTLARFEFALGRRISWSFNGHQLKVAPHAFAEANAFYTKEREALLLGYFQGKTGKVFTCLSHDVIAHETTHALLDGLRERYTDPSSPDQAAFHEGFADVVALLSVLSVKEFVRRVLLAERPKKQRSKDKKDEVLPDAFSDSVLLGLAEQLGKPEGSPRDRALRRSVDLARKPTLLTEPEYQEPHRRGEIFVAAVMQTFEKVLVRRLAGLRRYGHSLDVARVSEESSELADALLTMLIRAIDYTPPVHLSFGDYLSAVLTADSQLRLREGKYKLRQGLREGFAAFNILPSANPDMTGTWDGLTKDFLYQGVHFDALMRDPDEVFRFAWLNKDKGRLNLSDVAFNRILSVRPCERVSPQDGFHLRETVAELVQTIRLPAKELPRLGMERPAGVEDDREISLHGGIALIFDEYGRLKYHIGTRVDNAEKQQARIEQMAKAGCYDDGARSFEPRFAVAHRARLVNFESPRHREEAW